MIGLALSTTHAHAYTSSLSSSTADRRTFTAQTSKYLVYMPVRQPASPSVHQPVRHDTRIYLYTSLCTSSAHDHAHVCTHVYAHLYTHVCAHAHARAHANVYSIKCLLLAQCTHLYTSLCTMSVCRELTTATASPEAGLSHAQVHWTP